MRRVKKLISGILCFVLFMTSVIQVQAENANEDNLSLFEVKLVEQSDTQSEDLLQEEKIAAENPYLSEFELEVVLGSKATLSVVSAQEKPYEFVFMENTENGSTVLAEGAEQELQLDFTEEGQKTYEIQILDEKQLLEVKKIVVHVQKQEENDQSSTDGQENAGVEQEEQKEAPSESIENTGGSAAGEGENAASSFFDEKGIEKSTGTALTGTLTSNKSTGEYVNRSVRLTANVTGGNGDLEYQFSEVYNGVTKVVQAYSDKNTYSFTTKEIGKHNYYVDVKDNTGQTLRLSYTMTIVLQPGYEMVGTLTSNKTTAEYENRSVTLTAKVSKGYGGYNYVFKESYNGITKTVQTGEDSTYSFKTDRVGSHTYIVIVTDKAGQQLELKYKMNVYEEPVVKLKGTLTSSKSTGEYVNRSVKLTANVTGGNGTRKYQFSENYNGETKVVQEYSTKNTYSFTTKEIGKHTYYVDVKDHKGQTLRLSYTMTVVPQSGYQMAGTMTSNKTTAEYENRSVTLTVNMKNGYGGYSYVFKEGYNGTTKTVQKGEKNTYSFKTAGVGSHTYAVVVTDKAGQQLELKYKMQVCEEPVVKLAGTLKSNKSTGEYVNRGVTLTADVTGGNGTRKYQFSENYNGETKVVQEYSTKNTYSFTTKEIGKHTYYVDVKDNKGQTLRLSYTMTVVPQSGYEMAGTLTSNKTTAEYENRSVTLTAKLSKGYGGYNYVFKESYNGITKTVQEGEKNTYSFTTKGVGSHTYTVTVTDKAGQLLELKYKMQVYAEPDTQPEQTMKGTLTSNKSTGEYAKRSVTLTADVTGGNGTLEYQFSETYNGETKVVQKYSSKNTYSFSTKGVGIHTYYVDVKDSKGKTLKLSYKMTVAAHPDYEIAVGLSSNKTTTEYVGRSIALTATASGGYDKNYEYQFSETYGGETVVVQKFSKDNTYHFTTKTVGSHIYTVTVRDGQNQTKSKSYSMTVKIHPDYQMYATLESNKTTAEYSNRSVTLTASASGGYGEYQYQFVRVYEGGSKIVRNYSTSNKYTFMTGIPGNYTYYVNVKDKANNVVQASYFMQVASDGNLFKGIDVSSYQGNINWAKVKAEGVNFAMLRVVENKMGALAVDSKFYQNAAGATANGIAIGAYRYGYAMSVSEARTEAYAVVNALKASGCTFRYPIAYDMEDWETQGTLSMAERTAIIKTFREIIEENGYTFMIYASRSWLESMIDMEEFAGEDVWVAEYRDYTPDLGHQYRGPGRVTIWQYSSRGKVSGISGDVDMNIGYMKY
ncbi:GH25 family lysozyme [Faecalicatena acetigenes]|uniref:GH25 family lysozyme n=1 Tax=Faecalicatena acetigenes TaxID=2981790 RepID=A0ABT2TBV4_9FIRM|nr:GH25 family lysozyme [Faecalicatena acetigenes]MCU6747763.1 GH25 family lysozyme [Faecalicatena acetigenes]SCI07923.1 Lysozyme M1 precursor [uncultured Clostridium sp.]